MWEGECQRRNSNGGIQLPLKALVPLPYGKLHIQYYNRVTQSLCWKSLRWLPEPHWVSCPARLSRVFKRLFPSNMLGPHSVCVKHNSCADTVIRYCCKGTTWRNTQIVDLVRQTHITPKSSQISRYNWQLIQCSMFIHRVLSPQQIHILTGITVWQRKHSCSALRWQLCIFTRYYSSTSPKWKYHIF